MKLQIKISWLPFMAHGVVYVHSLTEDFIRNIIMKFICHSSSTIQYNTMQSNIKKQKRKKETRMWTNAQREAALPNIGGALCSTP